MKAYLFQTNNPHPEYWLLSAAGNNITVYDCQDIEWAELQPQGVELVVMDWDGESPWEPRHTLDATEYLSVSVWDKYYFPRFKNDREDFSYQLYEVGQMDTISDLVKECIALARRLGIADLGSQ